MLKWKRASGLYANSALKLIFALFFLFAGDGREGSWGKQYAAQYVEE